MHKVRINCSVFFYLYGESGKISIMGLSYIYALFEWGFDWQILRLSFTCSLSISPCPRPLLLLLHLVWLSAVGVFSFHPQTKQINMSSSTPSMPEEMDLSTTTKFKLWALDVEPTPGVGPAAALAAQQKKGGQQQPVRSQHICIYIITLSQYITTRVSHSILFSSFFCPSLFSSLFFLTDCCSSPRYN